MNKKKIFLIFFSILMFIFLFLNIVNAACSIGANPLSMGARALPGQTVFATWNLYNIHGDRTTHVKLSTVEAPSDWKISFEPELHKAPYEVMGVVQTIEENVALEVTPVVKTKPETIPEGMNYVKHPNLEGYIPVKVIKMYIEVPKDAELWKEHDLVFGATGNCFTEPGAVVPGVATQLKLKVKIISEEFTETPLEKATIKFDIDFSTILAIKVSGSQGDTKTFTLDGETKHTLTYKEITKDSVTLIIESEPVEVTLKKGEYKRIDIDNDNVNDLKILLNKITDGVAELAIKKIEVEGAEPEVELVKTETKEPTLQEPITGAAVKEPSIAIPLNMTTGVIIILLLTIIVLLVVTFVKKKK